MSKCMCVGGICATCEPDDGVSVVTRETVRGRA